MLHARIVRAAFLSIASMLAAASASADPIAVTAGFLTLDRSMSMLRLEGERGFSLAAFNPIPPASDPGVICNGTSTSCTPGSTVSFRVASAGSDLGGQATLDNLSFPVGLDSPTRGAAAIDFISAFVVPEFSGAETISVLAPFSFSGFVQPPFGMTDAVAVMLVGNGTVRFDLQWVTRDGGPGWDFQRARYRFTEAAPVPEPATLVLVGSGAALCFARRRRAPRH